MYNLLNVVLGLFVVFLIFAIVVSRLQEWLSDRLSSRGKFLRDGIHRLVGDEALATRILRHQLVSGLYYDRAARTAPPSYIEPANFALALANVLVRRGVVAQDPAQSSAGNKAVVDSASQLTYDTLRAALLSAKAQRSPVADALLPVVDRAKNDLDTALRGIESWYSGGMDRVSGWYKTSARRRLFVIGFILAALVNVDAIELFRSLNKSPEDAARLAGIAQDIQRTGTFAGIDLRGGDSRPRTDEQDRALNTALVDASRQFPGLPIGWACLGAMTAETTPQAKVVSPGTPEKPAPTSDVVPAPSAWSTCRAQFDRTTASMGVSDWLVKLVGWLITAFAGSLGATYWFGVISKVMDIRSSGPRPASAAKA